MGPLFVLVCPCFRKNVIVTCKIVYFSCSFDDFPLKNVIAFNLRIHIFKWLSFEKEMAILDPFFTLFTRQKTGKFLQHMSYLLKNTYLAHPFDLFCLANFAKKKVFSLVRLLVCILICANLNNQWITKWWAKFKLDCLLHL